MSPMLQGQVLYKCVRELLIGTLYMRLMILFILHLYVIRAGASLLQLLIGVVEGDGFEGEVLGELRERGAGRESGFQSGDKGGVDIGREGDVDGDVEVSEIVMAP